MLRYLFIFCFVSCSLAHAAVGSLKELFNELKTAPIAQHLCRSLSQRGELLQSVDHSHRFYFTNGHWVKGLSYEKTVDGHFPLLSPTARTTLFHTELAQTLINGIDSGRITSDKYRKNAPFKRAADKRALNVYVESPSKDVFKFEEFVEPNFVDGHRLTVEGKTVYPKVLVNLYEEAKEENPAAPSKPSTAKWFMPIEQAFFFHNLETYKRNVALFNRWCAYSRFVLMVIPQGTDIRAHIGITAPQSLIENADIIEYTKSSNVSRYQTEMNERVNRASNYLKALDPSTTPTKLNNDLLKFCEFFPGGATQFFMEYVKDYYLFDIEALYSNGSPFSPNFSTRRERDGINWAVPSPP